MLKGLFKPKWQSKNPSVRLKGLESLTGDSEELIGLAIKDPDDNVRSKAIQNLHHIPTLISLASSSNINVQKITKARLAELALSHSVDDQALAKAYPLIDDVSIHTKVITDTKKSTAVRKQALEHINDQDLCFELAKSDPSKEIQFIAASRLVDFEKLKKLEKLTTNNKKLRQLLKDRSNAQQAKEEQQSKLKHLCDEIKQLGTTGKWEQDKTRFLVIQQQWKNSPTALTELLQNDFDTAIHEYENKLQIHQSEVEKLQPLRNSFQTIIHTLENLIATLKQNPHKVVQTEVDEITLATEQSWIELKSKLPETEVAKMAETYAATAQQLKTTRTEFDETQKSLKQFQSVQTKAEKLLASKHPIQQKQIKDLKQQWQKLKAPIGLDNQQITDTFNKIINNLQSNAQRQVQQAEAELTKIQQALNTLETEIKTDLLGQAIETYHTANTLIRNAQLLSKQQLTAVKQRLFATTDTVKSAQGWRHWGTDKVREQLIEQAQTICDEKSTKPLKRAEQIKSLRDDWKRLGKMDPSRHQKLWEKFDSTCSKAYEPCKQYFKEESNTRKNNLQQRENICKQLQQLETETDWKNVNWKDKNKEINQLRLQWKKIGTVNRADWSQINEKFNTAMDALEVHLSNERRINWTKRENLVKQAKALVNSLENTPDAEAALPSLIEQAKSLQSQWQPTVTAGRAEEQKLWNEFRHAIDSLFNTQRENQNANRDELNSNLQNKLSILQQAEELTKLKANDLLAAEKQIILLEKDFNTITALPRTQKAKGLEAKFEQAKKRLEEKVQHHHHKKSLDQLSLLGEKAKLCAQKEAGKNIQEAWDKAQKLDDDKLEAQIQQRCENSEIAKSSDNTEQLSKLTLEIEILLDLETPEEYRQERMKLQVERLSEQMLAATQSKESSKNIALQKIQDWYLIPATSPEDQARLEQRFLQVEKYLET